MMMMMMMYPQGIHNNFFRPGEVVHVNVVNVVFGM